jgi:hypothetical protein
VTALSYLYEEPRRDEGQATVLPIEAVVISIEREVVQIEEPATSKPIIPSLNVTLTTTLLQLVQPSKVSPPPHNT